MKARRLAYLVTVPLSIFLGILTTVHGGLDPHTSGSSTNETPIRAETRQRVSRDVDPSVQPCDDFYEHACFGKRRFPASHTKENNESKILNWFKNIKSNAMEALSKFDNHGSVLTKEEVHRERAMSAIKKYFSPNETWPLTVPFNEWVNQKLDRRRSSIKHIDQKIELTILESFNSLTSDDMEAFGKSKKFHDACTKQETDEKKFLSAIKTKLSRNGEWPITVSSNEPINQTLSWQEIHENFAKNTGISALFDVIVHFDDNSKVHTLSLVVPTVPSERPISISWPRNKNYRKYVKRALRKFSNISEHDIEADDWLADFEGIMAFESKLKKVRILDDNRADNKNDIQMITIEKLQRDWDDAVMEYSNYSINWLETIKGRFEGTGIVINASEYITLKPEAFVTNLTNVLLNNPHRTIVNYIYWKVVDDLLPYVRSGLHDPDARKPANTPSPEKFCILNNLLSHAISCMWMKQLLTVETKEAALEMVKSIQKEIWREIYERSWLDDKTKSVIQEKINTSTINIGYPDWYDDPDKIDEYYRELEVGSDHFENVLAYKKFEKKRILSKLGRPADRSENIWKNSVNKLNIMYSNKWNAITIGPALLLSPYFEYSRSTVLNYAELGIWVGGAFTYAFDQTGQRYNKDGRIGEWWSQSMIETYNDKEQCFVDQYNKYTFVNKKGEPVHLNGERTKRENIADIIGVLTSLRAYQILENDGKTNNIRTQPLIDYTYEKIFFYQYAFTFCTLKETYAEDIVDYSPLRERVNGVLSNTPEFATAFDCPTGSPMNPPDKCVIWN